MKNIIAPKLLSHDNYVGVQHESESSSPQAPLFKFQVTESLREFVYSKKTFSLGKKKSHNF